MEDDGFEEPMMETKPKAKRKLTQAQLDQLAKAREKANAVRKKNAQAKQSRKQKEKQLHDMQRQIEQEDLDNQIQQLSNRSKKPVAVEVPEVEEESSESSESEEPSPPPKKAKKAKKVKKVKKVKKRVKRESVSFSTSSDDEDYVPPKKQWVKQHRQDALYDRQMQRAFASLFPDSYVG